MAPKPQPSLIGFYQSDGDVNGCYVQLSIWRKETGFTLFIDNREVSKGIFKKYEDNTYELNGDEKNFTIKLEHDNTFEIVISKLNNGKPIQMINMSYVPMGFPTEFNDEEKYKELLN